MYIIFVEITPVKLITDISVIVSQDSSITSFHWPSVAYEAQHNAPLT